jgi:NADH-quinone oxidoreductase subunit A
MLSDFIPLLIEMLLAGGLSLTLLKAAEIFGPRRPNFTKRRAYESGMDPIGTARERYSVKFYLVAMIFIVFDVEVVILYPWAVSFRDFIAAGVGPGVLGVVVLFIVILGIGLLYDIKKGGLDFRAGYTWPYRPQQRDVASALGAASGRAALDETGAEGGKVRAGEAVNETV